MEPPDRPRSAFRRWAREVKSDIKDSFKKLIRSRSSTPRPQADHETQAQEGQDTMLIVDAGGQLASGSGLIRTQSNSGSQIAPALEHLPSTAPLSLSSDNLPGGLQLPIAMGGGLNDPNAQSSLMQANHGLGAASQTPVQTSLIISGASSAAGTPADRVSTSVNVLSAGSATTSSGRDASAFVPSGCAIDKASGPDSVPTKEPSKVNDSFKVGLNFTQTLLKRLPEIVDGNPVKMAFTLAKTIIEIKEAVGENMDAVERRISSTAAQLVILDGMADEVGNEWLDRFKR